MTSSDPFPAEIERAIARSPNLWEQLRGRSLLLTGGTGLFGRWLLQSMIEADRRLDLGLHVHLLTRDPAAFVRRAPGLAGSQAISFIEGDVKTFVLPDVQVDLVIHGAATSAHESFRGEPSLNKFDTILGGTRRMLDIATAHGMRKLLLLSSGAVYGNPSPGLASLSESCKAAPETDDLGGALGQAKRAAEYLSAEYAHAHGFDLVIARCFSFVGPLIPLSLHYAIGSFIRQALCEDEIVINGDGSPIRSYLYLGDLVTWLFTLLLRQGRHRIYNVGSDRPVSILELAHLVRDRISPGKSVRLLGQPGPGLSTPAQTYVPDIERARSDFGLDVWTGIDEAIRLTARHAAATGIDRGLKA